MKDKLEVTRTTYIQGYILKYLQRNIPWDRSQMNNNHVWIYRRLIAINNPTKIKIFRKARTIIQNTKLINNILNVK